ncbi:FAD-binding oxidoreductase [Rhodobacteraceae bacterium NNCM2]|nr:FAD-binding oxidoreductase [Coraliihabitans acroporae]
MSERTDVLVIGAGVFGLWIALEAARAGLSVIVTERDRPGAGASGGVVGALTPHMPVRWRPMKQFQLDALMSMKEATDRLTAETGLETGYALSGRLSPLIDQRARDRAEEHALAAEAEWAGGARFEVLETPPAIVSGFLPAESCPFGLVRDTLSGRITPRLYIDALAAAVSQQAQIRTGWEAIGVDGETGTARFDKGEISAGTIVIAAGAESTALAPVKPGGGVKGQAALLRVDTPAEMPVVQMPHLYIVRQPGGLVAIGSTSEKEWQDPGPDTLLDEVIERARRLCPGLSNAEVVERWAGIRPKPPGREPTIGRVPGARRLYLATGGYKIGLGIAHLVGRGVAAELAGIETDFPIPEDFAVTPATE